MNEASIVTKIVVKGKLKLITPLLIGNGSQNEHDISSIDSSVLRDNKGNLLIPGTSIAGVLREYLYSINRKFVSYLFGSDKGDKVQLQSAVLINDIIIDDNNTDSIDIRDGVSIDGITNTSIKTRKYDFEVIKRGTCGDFYAEIILRKYHIDTCGNDALSDIGKVMLRKLATGFSLGADTTKGLGKVVVKNLIADIYNFTNKEDILNWLHPDGLQNASIRVTPDNVKPVLSPKDFVMDARFSIPHSLIVRNYDDEVLQMVNEVEGTGNAIKATMLKSGEEYLIPGSSLKGVLRHRAEYILDKLGKSHDIIDELMGYSSEKKDQTGKQDKKRSRLYVDEVYIDNSVVHGGIQSRNRLDRITGGTIDGALFTSQPIWQTDRNCASIKIHLEVKNAEKYEIGLMLCLLKDMWLGRVAIGGEKSIGRGIIRGIKANIIYGQDSINITLNNSPLGHNELHCLNKYVDELINYDR